MTISATAVEMSVVGTGSVGPVSFPYPVHAETELVITRTPVGGDPIAATLGVDFTVVVELDYSGADITWSADFAAAANGQTIRIRRVLPLTQPLDLVRTDRLPSSALERELDRSAMRDQQIEARVTTLETLTATFTPDVIVTPTGCLTPQLCGAAGDGVTNDTAAWQLFLDTLRTTDVIGLVPGGSYLITAGSLEYQCATTGRGPIIFTTGAPLITLTGATNGPGLSILGSDDGYEMVRGGYIGPIQWEDDAPASGRHAFKLRGVEGMTFEGHRAVALGGYLFHVPEALIGGSNPDPYNVAYCRFIATRAEDCGGLLLNENGVGFTQNTFEGFLVTDATGDAIVCGGSNNAFRNGGLASCDAWAIHNPEGEPGAPNRNIFENIEIDDCYNGIKHRRGVQDIYRGIRIYHRYHAGDDHYHPRTAIAISTASHDTVWRLQMDVLHVIVSGGGSDDLGVFCDFNSSNNVFDCEINQRERDDAGFGFADPAFYANINTLSEGLILYRGTREIWRSAWRELFHAVGNSGSPPNFATSGFATTSSRLVFGTEIIDRLANYNSSTGVYTVENTQRHRFAARITGAFPLGERVRVALMYTRSAANNYLTGVQSFSANGDYHTVELEWEGEVLQAGDEVWLSVEAASTVAMAASYDFGGENYFRGARV